MSAELSSVAPPGKRSTYLEILHSTLLIGGSSVINIFIGVVRTKVMAILLGPAGFGLMGVYTSIADLARSVAEMGINSSGVRQIAESVGSGDANRVARTIHVLRRTAIALGLISALLLLLFARPISSLTFGTDDHAGAVALLSVATFIRLVSDGQGALLQGMRRVSDLARVSVLGAAFGTLASIPVVYYMREDGVVPSLVVVAAASGATSWWYSRQVKLQPCQISRVEASQEAVSLLKLGMAFMVSALMGTAAAYVVRLIVIRQAGLEAAGYYQAAWSLGGLYVGIVLQAMGTDFYPRLVAAITDSPDANRLVNEQAQVSLLLAGPGVIATLTLAPLVIHLFYTADFESAIVALRWICLGMALRVISWPMGYIIVAHNRRAIYLGTELAWTAVNIGLSWACVQTYGLAGAGMAFAGSYVFHCLLVYAVVRSMNGFRWSTDNWKTGLLFLGSIGSVFYAFENAPPSWALSIGLIVLLISSVYSLRMLLVLVPADRLPRRVRRLRGVLS